VTRKTKPVTSTPLVKPKLYVLAIGVSDYQRNDHLDDLTYTAKDAEDFAACMKRQEGRFYEKVSTKLLTNQLATASEIRGGLEWIQKETTSKDIAIIFMSGHGENDEKLRYHFCPHDYDPAQRLKTGIPNKLIVETLSEVPGKVLVFIDSCHAGNALGKLMIGKSSTVDVTGAINEFKAAESGAAVFASSTGRQISNESAEWKNSAFTLALVEGIGGKADLFGTGKITIYSLHAYVAERVKSLTAGTQTPTAILDSIPDFPIGIAKP
jgi:uncharacterized caspase-like protein